MAKEPLTASHRRWCYHPSEPARIFEQGEVIPDGWSLLPIPDPLDHDGDGRKGGSRKAKAR